MCSRPVSGLWAQSTECMSTELSVESDSWNSGYVFCVHYCFVLSVVSINMVIHHTLGLSVTIHKTENFFFSIFSHKNILNMSTVFKTKETITISMYDLLKLSIKIMKIIITNTKGN